MKKLLLVLSMLLNIVLIGKIVWSRYSRIEEKGRDKSNDSIVTYSFNKYKLFAQREGLFRLAPLTKGNIVFVGNSLTETFPVTQMFNNLNVRNRGIAGNNSDDILKRIDSIALSNPSKLFLMAGINDIVQAVPKERTFENIAHIIAEVRRYSPQTHIYFESILPVMSDKRCEIIVAYNKYMQQWCLDNHVTFVNLFPLFYNGHCLKSNLAADDVHINAAGYLIWKKAAEPYVTS